MALEFATNTGEADREIIPLMAIQRPEIPIYGVNPMVIVEPDYADIDAIRTDARCNLEGVAQTLKDEGFHPTIRVEVGEPAHTILQVASELDVDLIIMSTHGRYGVSRWLFGSVTGRVLNMASRPVLIVPSHEQQQKFEREIAELNFS